MPLPGRRARGRPRAWSARPVRTLVDVLDDADQHCGCTSRHWGSSKATTALRPPEPSSTNGHWARLEEGTTPERGYGMHSAADSESHHPAPAPRYACNRVLSTLILALTIRAPTECLQTRLEQPCARHTASPLLRTIEDSATTLKAEGP